jgi:hypothetical protein
MEISETDILKITHYGLGIYAYILRRFYPGEVVVSLSGHQCKPVPNPFTGGSKTLNIFNKDWVFLFEDTLNPDLKGNPFDFAALYYHLSGSELLQKLNDDMGLLIGEDHSFYRNRKPKPSAETPVPKPEKAIPSFSFFRHPVKNTVPSKVVTLVDVFHLLHDETYKEHTAKLRSIPSKDQARAFKAENFDYVTFSGIFSKRNDHNLLKHSGLITVDFDHVPDLQSLKNALLNDEYFETELMFVSPSGDGLKWIIPVDLTQATHQLFFQAIARYIQQTYALEVDKSGRDISRACFLPYDNEVYISPKYLT